MCQSATIPAQWCLTLYPKASETWHQWLVKASPMYWQQLEELAYLRAPTCTALGKKTFSFNGFVLVKMGGKTGRWGGGGSWVHELNFFHGCMKMALPLIKNTLDHSGNGPLKTTSGYLCKGNRGAVGPSMSVSSWDPCQHLPQTINVRLSRRSKVRIFYGLRAV